MSIFVFLLLLATFFFFILFGLFVWGIKSGQMDDLVTPAERMLWEDPKNDEHSDRNS